MFIQQKHCSFKCFCIYVYFKASTFIKVGKILLFGDFFKGNKPKPTSTIEIKIFAIYHDFLTMHSLLKLFRIVTQVSNFLSVFQKLTSWIFQAGKKKSWEFAFRIFFCSMAVCLNVQTQGNKILPFKKPNINDIVKQ